ncbi:MAG TPA: hypothetical protein VHV51_05540, partial [Polyangiaceae bacterium]|nr:hypothetical protein [Polyangiaceae bacterium]
MKQDFRAEDLAAAQRLLVSVDGMLAFAAFALLIITLADRRRPRATTLLAASLPLALGFFLASADTSIVASAGLLPPELLLQVARGAKPSGWAPLCVGLALSAAIAAGCAPLLSAACARIPERARSAVQYGVLALTAMGLVFAFEHVLEASHFLEHLPNELTPAFAPKLLLAVPLGLLLLAGTLRLLEQFGLLLPVWARMAAEALLVPAAYLLGLAIIYQALVLVDLELWQGFKPAAFASAAVFALPVALVPGAYRARGFGIVFGLLLLIVFGDLIYLRYFGNILPVLAISSGGQIWDVRDIIFKYTQRRDAWLLPTLVASVALAFLWPKTPKRDAPIAARATLDLVLVCSALAFLLPIQSIVQSWMDNDRSW